MNFDINELPAYLLAVGGFLAALGWAAEGVDVGKWKAPQWSTPWGRRKRLEEQRLEELQHVGEPFQAFTVCPKCKSMQFHWIEPTSLFGIVLKGRVKRECRECTFTWRQY